MQLMFSSTFFAMTLSCSEQQVHTLTLPITEQRPCKHLMEIQRQNIYEATILGENEVGYSTKKPNRGDLLFWKKPLDFLGLPFCPWKFWTKHTITPENLAKLCFHTFPRPKTDTWKFHVFFLIILGKFTSFLIDPWNFCVLFLQYLWKIHALRKFDLIQIFPYFLSLTKSFSNSWGTQPVYYIFYARISSAPLLVVNGNFLQWNQ